MRVLLRLGIQAKLGILTKSCAHPHPHQTRRGCCPQTASRGQLGVPGGKSVGGAGFRALRRAAGKGREHPAAAPGPPPLQHGHVWTLQRSAGRVASRDGTKGLPGVGRAVRQDSSWGGPTGTGSGGRAELGILPKARPRCVQTVPRAHTWLCRVGPPREGPGPPVPGAGAGACTACWECGGTGATSRPQGLEGPEPPEASEGWGRLLPTDTFILQGAGAGARGAVGAPWSLVSAPGPGEWHAPGVLGP